MPDDARQNALIIPALGRVYARFDAAAETLLRVVCGLALIAHGFPKILDPFGSIGTVERLGFYPGAFWSPVLAVTEFLAGVLITIGFLTRPAALAATVILAVTIWFHWITLEQGYSGSEKSIIWTALALFFTVRGGNRHSVDAKLGRAF